jgi:hypothetical protein
MRDLMLHEETGFSIFHSRFFICHFLRAERDSAVATGGLQLLK